MSRWWTEEGPSRAALARVDDSDVVQGVGTAVLGYHGLAYEQLRPLAARTLVDIDQVQKALGQVDLEPVAKALAEATRPVMGEAADRYGQVLAEDMHERSITHTSQLITNLASSGLPWPQAIQRAADLHGVPIDRLGSALQAMKAPVLNPMAQIDMADRVLMEYASHRGKRENTVRDISKAKARSRDFEEEEHPRAGDGTFTHKARAASSTAAEVDAAKDRIAQLKMRQARQARTKVRRLKAKPVATEQQRTSLYEMDDEPPASSGRRKQAMSPRQEAIAETQSALDITREKLGQRQKLRMARAAAERKQAALEQLRRATTPTPASLPPPAWDISMPVNNEPRDENGKFAGVVMPTTHKRYVLVPEWVAVEIVKAKGVNIGALIYRTDDPQMVAMRHPEMTEALTQLGINARSAPRDQGPASQVMLVFDGDVAFAEGSDNATSYGSLAPGGTYTRYIPLGLQDSPQTKEGFDHLPGMFAYTPYPASPKKVDFSRAIHLKLSNDKEIAQRIDQEELLWGDELGDETELPYDRFGGAEQGTQWYPKADDFDENEHRRDARGRFRDKAVAPEMARPESLLERQAKRRQRKALRARRQRPAAERVKTRLYEMEDEPTRASARQAKITERQQEITQTREGLAQMQAQALMRARAMKQNARSFEERKRLAAEGKGPNLGLAGMQVANLPPDVVMALVEIGEFGGTYGDEVDQVDAESRALDAMKSFDDEVDALVEEARTKYKPTRVVTTYMEEHEADDAGRRTIAHMNRHPGKFPIMAALEFNAARLYVDTRKVGSEWTATVRAHLPGVDLLVVSDDDLQAWSKAQAPVRVVAGNDPVTLSELMAESGRYSPEEITDVSDRYVAIYRLDFGDDLK